MIKRKSYSELMNLKTYEERLEYLRMEGSVGKDTFGFDRYMNQNLYRSREWKDVRNKVIMRDLGCDLGIEGREIESNPIIHHINPITADDIKNSSYLLFDMDNLITVNHDTHNAIHYGALVPQIKIAMERQPYDTCPWRRN